MANTTAWSLWGNASNTSSNDQRSSEKYAVGGRSRYNMTDSNYLFGQASWLTDRYNGYQQRDVLTAGYGRQILNGPVHSLRLNLVLACATTNIPMATMRLSRWATLQAPGHGR
nr:membrane protein [Raoultella sp. NCTC 9187]